MNSHFTLFAIGVIIAFLCSVSGCKKIDFLNPCVPPPAVVPSKTSKGLNTFGCKVNGKSWSYNPVPYFWNWEKGLYCVYTEPWDHVNIRATRNYKLSCDSVVQRITFSIKYVNGNDSLKMPFSSYIFQDFQNKCNGKIKEYELDTIQPYGVHLFYKDLKKRIFSGTFYFTAISKDCLDTVRITDGVFDIVADPG